MNNCTGNIKRHIMMVILFSIFIAISVFPANACTLWGSVGKSSKNKSTIIAKNRDWTSSLNLIRKIIPSRGFKYFAIFGEKKGKSTGVKAGINEKGLMVISSTASSLPKKERKYPGKRFSINSLLLKSYSSVDEVLKNRQVFSRCRPSFIMVGDKSKIAIVEVAPHGKYFIKQINQGPVCHTNHYIDNPEFFRFNKKRAKSSRTRLKRITELIGSYKNPLTVEDFKKIGSDKNNGPDNSLWRTGSTPKKSRTLATFIAEIPKHGPPVIYIKTANPDEPEKEYTFTLDGKFWAAKKVNYGV